MTCADPSPVANAVYSPPTGLTGPYVQWDMVTYTCNTGYYLSAGSFIYSLCDLKEWFNIEENSTLPTCLGKI